QVLVRRRRLERWIVATDDRLARGGRWLRSRGDTLGATVCSREHREQEREDARRPGSGSMGHAHEPSRVNARDGSSSPHYPTKVWSRAPSFRSASYTTMDTALLRLRLRTAPSVGIAHTLSG